MKYICGVCRTLNFTKEKPIMFEDSSFPGKNRKGKNMYENKKLNLNQPILSVRKNSATEVNRKKTENSQPISGLHLSPPVKIAGSVPFHWEEIPGQPKQKPGKFILTEESGVAYVDAPKRKSPVRRTKVKIARRSKEEKQASDCDRHGYSLPNFGLRPRFCSTSSVRPVSPVSAKNDEATMNIGCGSNYRKSFKELILCEQGSSKGRDGALDELDDMMMPLSPIAQEKGFPKKETTKKKQVPGFFTLGNSVKNCSDQFRVHPPLLKSPSDSWLWRTLLSASTKNVSRHCSTEVMKTIVPRRV